MSEQQIPDVEYRDRESQVQRLVDNCRFLVFQLNDDEIQFENQSMADTDYGLDVAQYRLDGKRWIVTANYPESTYDKIASIEKVGIPEKDMYDRWFVAVEKYKVDGSSGEITVEQSDTYDYLDKILLPEYFEPIKDGYKKQRKTNGYAEDLGLDEMPSTGVLLMFHQVRSEHAAKILKEKADRGETLDIPNTIGALEEASNRALEGSDEDSSLGLYIKGVQRKNTEKLLPIARSIEIQKELGLNLVGKEELATLIGRIRLLREQPDKFKV